MALSRNGAIPLYYQLKVWLQEQIESGRYALGRQIPTETRLCEQFGISRGTVRQAIKELVDEGWLYLIHGRGTFVADHYRQDWPLVNLVSMAESLNRRSIPFETHVIEMSMIAAEGWIAGKLGLEPGAAVVYIKRLRSVEGEPTVIFLSYLAEKLGRGLLEADLHNASLYQALEIAGGPRVVSMDHVLSVRLVSDEESGLLGLPPYSPVMVSDELAYDADGQIVEYSLSIYRAEKSSFFIHSIRLPSEAIGKADGSEQAGLGHKS